MRVAGGLPACLLPFPAGVLEQGGSCGPCSWVGWDKVLSSSQSGASWGLVAPRLDGSRLDLATPAASRGLPSFNVFAQFLRRIRALNDWMSGLCYFFLLLSFFSILFPWVLGGRALLRALAVLIMTADRNANSSNITLLMLLAAHLPACPAQI